MQIVAGKLNSNYLETIVLHHVDDCSEVVAVVAYCDSTQLFDLCKEAGRRVTFYGRLDEGVPVKSKVLKWFHTQRNPNYSCYLLRGGLHAKIIWFKGEGVYIGSANLTDNGWVNNIEAGIFVDEEELAAQGLLDQLSSIVDAVHERSSPLSDEILSVVEELENKRASLRNGEQGVADWFKKTCKVPEAPPLSSVDRIETDDKRKKTFLKEWNGTLQLLRNISTSLREYRPAWVESSVPDGVHVDQFLHAYYYLKVREGNRQPFDEYFVRNRNDPASALTAEMIWWRVGEYPHESESEFMHQWAPLSRTLLSKERIGSLNEIEFIQLCARVHAIRDHAIKLESKMLGLREGRHVVDVKIEAFGKWLYAQRSVEGKTVIETIYYVLYGGDAMSLPDRLWSATRGNKWKIDHLGLSSLGEIVGWALPDKFPPRNSRTSKALRALGNNVSVY